MSTLVPFEIPLSQEEPELNYSNLKIDYHLIQIMKYACKGVLTDNLLESFERIEAHLNAAKERYDRLEKKPDET